MYRLWHSDMPFASFHCVVFSSFSVWLWFYRKREVAWRPGNKELVHQGSTSCKGDRSVCCTKCSATSARNQAGPGLWSCPRALKEEVKLSQRVRFYGEDLRISTTQTGSDTELEGVECGLWKRSRATGESRVIFQPTELTTRTMSELHLKIWIH